MLLLTDEHVQALTQMPDLVSAIREGYRTQARGGAQLPDRINLESTPGFFRLMPGVSDGAGLMGFKVFNQVSEGGVQYLIGLFDERTGELLAQLDGAYLTAARTGATTGVAAGFLAPQTGVEIGVIGSGLEAETNLEGVCAALDVKRVRVYSPNPQRRTAFVNRMAERLDVDVVAVSDPAEAAAAPVVVVATNTGVGTGRVALEGKWLTPGTTVLSIGSTMPSLREIDTDVVDRAALVVSDAPDQARTESGDLLAADEKGLLDGKLVALADLAGGNVPALDAGAITVFKSVGTALQDLVAAKVVYDRAVQNGIGTSVDLLRTKKPAGA